MNICCILFEIYHAVVQVLNFLDIYVVFVFFFKQKTAYEMRISDWSSDVCSSDLAAALPAPRRDGGRGWSFGREELHGDRRHDCACAGRHALRLSRGVPDLAARCHDVTRCRSGGNYSRLARGHGGGSGRDRKSVVSGKSVSVRVDLGCCRIIKQKKNSKKKIQQE